MFIRIADASCAMLTAHEVKQLAIKSMADIEATRTKMVASALDKASKETKILFFGLFSFPKYPTKEFAMEFSQEVNDALQFASIDYMTCAILQKMAQYLIDQGPNLPPERQLIQVTANDFRALT